MKSVIKTKYSPHAIAKSRENVDINKALQTDPIANKKSKKNISSNDITKPSVVATDDKIKVYLRVRPLLNNEVKFDFQIKDRTITIRPPEEHNTSYFCVDKSFTFRGILDSQASQQHVFRTVAEPLLLDFINGKDVLIFCYGSTNAGKTYTVTGTEKNPGILFQIVNKLIPDMVPLDSDDIKLVATFNEIYNERIYDLLCQDVGKESLSIGLNKAGDTEIKGCSEIPIRNVQDINRIITQGINGRHRGFTELNCDSSRSHTIFRLKLTKKTGYSWLSVVDLAGSERLSIMTSTMTSFKEACNINKSMLVLGKCIRSLKEQNPQDPLKNPIPYRESKLSYIFKNLFEPTNRDAKAAMIINISPSINQIDDTIFALQFAAEASECSIRQVSRPEDIPSHDEHRALIHPPKTETLELESIDHYRKQIQFELKKEMEKVFLHKKLFYEHQYQAMVSKFSAPQPNDPKQILQEISEIEGRIEALKIQQSENMAIKIQKQNLAMSHSKRINDLNIEISELEKCIQQLENTSELHTSNKLKTDQTSEDLTKIIISLKEKPFKVFV